MDDSQITGSTHSYAIKYALGNLLLCGDEQDADALNKHGKESHTKIKPTTEDII